MNKFIKTFVVTIFSCALLFQAKPQQKPHVIILNLSSYLWSGIATHSANFYKALQKNGFPTSLFTYQNSPITNALLKLGITSKPEQELVFTVKNAHIKKHPVIIICNKIDDVVKAKNIRQSYPVKILFIQHVHKLEVSTQLDGIDGVICVNKLAVEEWTREAQKNNINVGPITYIPPFFDDERFLQFTQHQPRAQFLQKEFGLSTGNLPVGCMIANFYNNLNHKSHDILFKALALLIHEKKKPLHMLLVGSGNKQEYLKDLTRKLHIDRYVHFIGFSQQVPAILFNTDFHVLASSNEAFGLVHLEAGIMKKPTIGATKTGAEFIIENGKTGLLFNNSDAQDLAEKIELLIDHKEMGQLLGNNAYTHVLNNFSSTIIFKKLEDLFDTIVGNKNTKSPSSNRKKTINNTQKTIPKTFSSLEKMREHIIKHDCKLWESLKNITPTEEKEIVVVIPSYNNKDWYQKNLDSVFMQNYTNYRIMYVDDASHDGTAQLVENYVKAKQQEHRVILIKNQERVGHLANYYHAIHTCNDTAIIIFLDGDDFLAHHNVFALLNKIYQTQNVWLTYGQLIKYPTGQKGSCRPYPKNIIDENRFREYSFVATHLRTCYAWLFKKIKVEDLKHEGQFFTRACDLAMMYPMLEMAGNRIQYIPDVLAIYNRANALNIFKVDRATQHNNSIIIKAQQRYQRL